MEFDPNHRPLREPDAPDREAQAPQMDSEPKLLESLLGGRVQAIFVRGLFTLLPLLLTMFLVIWLISSLESTLGNAAIALLPESFYIPGLGLAIALLIILATGLVVENYLAGKILHKLEDALKRAPVIRAIYSPIKDLTDLFRRTKGPDGGQRVVLVKVGTGIEVLGLVMRDQFSDLDKAPIASGTVAVFIPFSYGFGGFTALVAPEALRDAGIPAERALQLAITGWVKSSRAPQ